MTTQELCERLGNGTRVIGDTIIGIYGGFPFSIALTQTKKTELVAVNFAADGKIPNKLYRAVRKNLRPATVQAITQSQSWQAGVVSPPQVQLSVSKATIPGLDAYAVAIKILDVCTGALNGAKKPVLPPQKCAICKKGDCDSVALFGALYRPVHRNCVIKQNIKTNQSAAKNEESGNYIFGIIGALLGAAVGALPNMLLIIFASFHSGWLYFLIPVASYWGYKLLKGKLGNVARVVTIISSVIILALMYPVSTYVGLIRAGYTTTLGETILLYLTDFPLMDQLKDSWLGIVFLALGIAVCFKNLGTTNQDLIQDASNTLDSVTNRDGTHTPVMGYELTANREP